MNSKTKKIAAIFLLTAILTLSGCGCKKPTEGYKVNLEIWGVFDQTETFSVALQKYREINPFIGDIKYRKFEVDNYKDDLISGLASGKGPDIFYFGNTWLPSFGDKIEPAPDYLINEQQFRDNFVDVAADDYLLEGKAYAVPLYVDSLALYYNKDLFNAEGITSPPATWEEVEEDVRRLTKIDKYGNITQQGIAMGTAKNINRPTDLLGLLMMQKGAVMVSENKKESTLHEVAIVDGKTVPAGQEGLKYYTQFARSGSPLYCWNSNMHYSIDAFYEGTAAMMINYSWHYQTVKNKNSKLNFGVAKLPQFANSKPVNFSNYWGLAVSKNKMPMTEPGQQAAPVDNSVRIHEAWELIKYLTMKNDGNLTLINGLTGTSQPFVIDYDPAGEYSKNTGHPSGRRDIIEQQKNDPIIGPFAYGNLIAKSWYQARPEETELIIEQTIEDVNLGQKSISDAIELADNKITQLMR